MCFNSTVNPVLNAAEQFFDFLAARWSRQHLDRCLLGEGPIGALHPPRRLLGITKNFNSSSEDWRQRLRCQMGRVLLSLGQNTDEFIELLNHHAEFVSFLALERGGIAKYLPDLLDLWVHLKLEYADLVS